MTFGDLRTHSAAGAEASQLVRKLLGTKLWDGWFSLLENLEPGNHDWIPRQALHFVILALENLKLKHDALQEVKGAAEKSFALMTAASKKRRAVTKT